MKLKTTPCVCVAVCVCVHVFEWVDGWMGGSGQMNTNFPMENTKLKVIHMQQTIGRKILFYFGQLKTNR